MIKAIIFDMDGVLVDAKEWHYEALNMALQEFGYRIEEHEHLLEYDGLPTMTKLVKLTKLKGLPEILYRPINTLKQAYTLEMFHTLVQPQPHLERTLSLLSADGYKLGLASNSIQATVDAFLDKSGYRRYFSIALSNNDVVHPKPAPDIYNLASSLLQEKPYDCLVVEDNQNGITAALSAGTHVFPVTSSLDVIYEAIRDTIQEINNHADI